MIFSKSRFLQNAGRTEKMALKNDLDVLNGKAVDTDGKILYEVDGEKYYLYPVMPGWCKEAINCSKK